MKLSLRYFEIPKGKELLDNVYYSKAYRFSLDMPIGTRVDAVIEDRVQHRPLLVALCPENESSEKRNFISIQRGEIFDGEMEKLKPIGPVQSTNSGAGKREFFLYEVIQ